MCVPYALFALRADNRANTRCFLTVLLMALWPIVSERERTGIILPPPTGAAQEFVRARTDLLQKLRLECAAGKTLTPSVSFLSYQICACLQAKTEERNSLFLPKVFSKERSQPGTKMRRMKLLPLLASILVCVKMSQMFESLLI
jgi:hypothetical protein